MLDTRPFMEVIDATLSAERIENAPVVIRSLFREFSHPLVHAALTQVGLDQDPSTLAPEFVETAAAQARTLILDHISEDIENRLRGAHAHRP